MVLVLRGTGRQNTFFPERQRAGYRRRANTLGRRRGGCYSRTMTGQPIAQILPRKKPRPQWIVPLVTALVFVAVIMVLYKPA